MVQRIGNNYNLLLMNKAIAENRYQHSKALEPIATGRAINRLSDDPSRLSEYFRVSNELGRLDQFMLNISNARSRIQITDSVLSQTSELVTEAYQIGLEGNNQTLGTAEIQNLVQRLSDIKEEIRSLGNTKLGSNYIFSGYQFATEPFNGSPVVFNGDSNVVRVKVTNSKEVQVSVNGDDVFTGGAGGVDIFATIDNLINDIQAQNEVTIGQDITDLQTALDQVITARTSLGNSGISLDTVEAYLEEFRIAETQRYSLISEVDMAEATTDLSFREFTLKSAFAVASRVLNITLQSFFE